jgi:ribose 1,5-bisphosphokinase
MQRGRLVYLIGASGAGKDSLIDAARPGLAERNVQVVRRIITRSAEASGEQAVGVSQEMFERMAAQGEFSLHWAANGLLYGIPADIDGALANGQWVLMNGSRGYLPYAQAKYPDLLAVLVTVSNEVLRSRLIARGRETAAQIDARLARNDQLNQATEAWQGAGSSLYRLDNSSTLAAATTALLRLLDEQRFSAAGD